MEIELEHIPKPTRDDMLSELRRVASLVESTHLTRTQFDRLARVSSSAIVRNFGGWSAALHLAGVAHKYSGRAVSPRMKAHAARQCTDEELLQSLHRVAEQLGSETVTMAQFNASDEPINASALTRRFGSWQAALAKAGLTIAPLDRRHTADDYFENLLAVWTHLGRQPYYREMDNPPSRITSSGYAAKFGSWRKAILAFMERVTISSSVSVVPEPVASSRQPDTTQ
jgi:Homing endonuclease associated repeat